ncbi:MAG: methionyl-tRNA formyltransferase [Actinobacteria bacterium]|nr:methionyl-tRNA formyltransferase [Actinomycetota bacterium]
MALKTIFFGTPAPAARCLQELIASRHQVLAVVTAPDKPAGRGMQLSVSPTKVAAGSAGIDIIQPETLRRGDIHHALDSYAADVFVVVAFGMILPKQVLDIPHRGCLNVHFSVLPHLRGAAPVQWALIEGFSITGVTVMQMDEGLDTGPIISQVEEPIEPHDTAGTLLDRLSVKGAELLVRTLDSIDEGRGHSTPQNHASATLAPKLSRDDARIDWNMDASGIANRVRAFDPRPGAWTTWKGRSIKLWKVSIAPDPGSMGPGSIDVAGSDLLFVESASNRLLIEELQPEGKSRMTASEFIRGYRPMIADRFE